MIVGMMLLVEQQQADAVAEGGGTEESMIDSRPAQTVSVNPYADDEPNVAGVQPKEWMTVRVLDYGFFLIHMRKKNIHGVFERISLRTVVTCSRVF